MLVILFFIYFGFFVAFTHFCFSSLYFLLLSFRRDLCYCFPFSVLSRMFCLFFVFVLMRTIELIFLNACSCGNLF